MKIKISNPTKYTLTELDGLDPISIIVENFEPGKGKIIIECYGQAWSNYWGAMSGKTIQEFFLTASNDYLVEKLDYRLEATVPDDGPALLECAKAQIKVLYDERDLEKDEAENLLHEVEAYLPYGIEENALLLDRIFGDDWWIYLPTKPNHEYVYLCRIVDAVRECFRKGAEQEALRTDDSDILTTNVDMIKACHDQGSVGLITDEERLNWVIFHSAIICHSRDGEICWIKYYEDELTLESDLFDDPREAIDAAMLGNVYEK